jgi:lysozyme
MDSFEFSSKGLDLLKSLEGFRAKAYPDSAGKMTIGYGHLIVPGDGVAKNDVIDPVKGTELLLKDVGKAVACVNNCVTSNINQNQFDALVIFAYNVGNAALQNSKLLQLVNASSFVEASEQFPRWCKVHTKQGAFIEIAGLKNRRLAERKLFEDDM